MQILSIIFFVVIFLWLFSLSRSVRGIYNTLHNLSVAAGGEIEELKDRVETIEDSDTGISDFISMGDNEEN